MNRISTTLAALSLLAALALTACGDDSHPDDESGAQTSELTDAERAAAAAQKDDQGHPVDTGTGSVTSTDLTAGGSTCVTCGPLPDPWTKKAGPLPDPWKSTSGGGGTGTGTGTSSTGTGSGH